jgi:hypothetical protein
VIPQSGLIMSSPSPLSSPASLISSMMTSQHHPLSMPPFVSCNPLILSPGSWKQQ